MLSPAENQHIPFAFEAFVRYLNEFAAVNGG